MSRTRLSLVTSRFISRICVAQHFVPAWLAIFLMSKAAISSLRVAAEVLLTPLICAILFHVLTRFKVNHDFGARLLLVWIHLAYIGEIYSNITFRESASAKQLLLPSIIGIAITWILMILVSRKPKQAK
jgi:hypothetical protein